MKVLVTLGLVLLISSEFVIAAERYSRNNRRNGKTKRPKSPSNIFHPVKPQTKFGEGKGKHFLSVFFFILLGLGSKGRRVSMGS